MSADLDAIARYDSIGYDPGMRPMHEGEWVRYSDHVARLEQAIAQDRKARELASVNPQPMTHSIDCEYPEGCSCGASEWNQLTFENAYLQQQLAQQSAALDSAINLVRRSQEDYQSSNSLGLWNERRDYLAQLAEAPRESAGHGGAK